MYSDGAHDNLDLPSKDWGDYMVSISIKARYAIAVLLKLAELFEEEEPIQTRVLAQLCDVPQTYLEQVLNALRRGGFIQSFRGSQGGYALAKQPDAIHVKAVLLFLEGPSDLAKGYSGCPSLKSFWGSVDERLLESVDISLKDLLENKQRHKKMLTYQI